jgi:hypothetical protein
MPEPLPRGILKERMSDWYRGVSVELDGEGIEARREAIEAMATSLDIASAPLTVGYAYGRKEYGQRLSDWIHKKAHQFDADFAVGPSDLEPRVMVACAIAHRLVTTPTNEVSSILSLLCQSAAFRGFRTAARRQDLVGLAGLQLAVAADRDKAAPVASEKTMVKAVNAAVKELSAAPESGGAASGLAEWLLALRSGLEAVAVRLDSVERSLASNAVTTREELDQVAWLLDEYCELGGRPWAQMKLAAIVVSGAELAEITAAPPPAQAGVMLRSTLIKAGRDPGAKVTAIEAIGRAASSLEIWPSSHGDVLLPISAALDAWREKGHGGANWKNLAREKRGGGELPDRTEGQLADQALRELIVAKALADV